MELKLLWDPFDKTALYVELFETYSHSIQSEWEMGEAVVFSSIFHPLLVRARFKEHP
jgi:hypothetical protein